jgi:hypothetical protein
MHVHGAQTFRTAAPGLLQSPARRTQMRDTIPHADWCSKIHVRFEWRPDHSVTSGKHALPGPLDGEVIGSEPRRIKL